MSFSANGSLTVTGFKSWYFVSIGGPKGVRPSAIEVNGSFSNDFSGRWTCEVPGLQCCPFAENTWIHTSIALDSANLLNAWLSVWMRLEHR